MTLDDERQCALKMRYPELKLESRGYGVIAQAVFFVLTAAGIAAFYFWTREAKLLTAVLCLALAEFLILGRKWMFTGVEAALWIGGLLAALMMLPNTGAPEASLLIALVFLIAGVRVRQPLFGVAAACFIAYYFEERFDLGTLVALLIATAALGALYRPWNRPSIEWLFAGLAIVMPFTAWRLADRGWLEMSLMLFGVFTAIAFASALVKRHHAMFAAAAAGAFVFVVLVQWHFQPPDELLLAVAGALPLAGSFLVSRALRGRTRGFVLATAEPSELEAALQTLGTLAATPSAGNPPEGRPQDGGGFGGAGATGSY